jgi:hypothetical protein
MRFWSIFLEAKNSFEHFGNPKYLTFSSKQKYLTLASNHTIMHHHFRVNLQIALECKKVDLMHFILKLKTFENIFHVQMPTCLERVVEKSIILSTQVQFPQVTR